MNHVQKVVKKFELDTHIESLSQIKSGHIHETYLLNAISSKKYVLQRINKAVFQDIHGLIGNKILVSKHLANSGTPYESIRFIKTERGEYFFKDDLDEYWMMMNYIDDSFIHPVATNKDLVCEAGKLFGDFIFRASSLDPNNLIETIPNFHSLPYRHEQFKTALGQASTETKSRAKKEIEFVLDSIKEMHELSKLNQQQIFPIRVTHNDAKLANILFDKNNKGLAVIDLDTVMPGIVAYDFGDSIRSICSTTKEDDSNLEATRINTEFYKAFCQGFSKPTKQLLTNKEIDYLPLGAKTITFIQGMRFLSDFLNDNVYYKTDYETHNLIRARNQFKLLQSIQENYKSLQNITTQAFK